MSFLTILQNVTDELGLTQTSSVTDTDAQTRQLVALANREGKELLQAHPWTFLQKEYVIETDDTFTVTGTLTAGSRVVTSVSDTSGLAANVYVVTGTGVKTSCRIASVDSSSQFTMTEEATTAGTGVTLTMAKDTYDMPSDFHRFIDRTQWDRSYKWAMIGPRSPQIDQWERSGVVSLGPRRRWRLIGGKFRVYPPPSSGDTAATAVFEYISHNWVTKAAGTAASSLTANDDTTLFPEDLMEMGIKWRFFQAKGFDYAAMQADYNDCLSIEKATDGGMKTLSLTRRRVPFLLSAMNVQDSDFPSS